MATLQPILPRPQSAIATTTQLAGGRTQYNITVEWYEFFRRLMMSMQTTENQAEQIKVIEETINKIGGKTTVLGLLSVLAIGTPDDGYQLSLKGDQDNPGESKYYGTDGDGVKGFYDLPSGGTNFVPYIVASGRTFFIQQYRQALFAMPIELEPDAYIECDGYLIGVD